MGVWAAWMSVCAPCAGLVPREHQVLDSLEWSYRCLWATMWGLEIKPGSSERAASNLNCWAVSWLLSCLFLRNYRLCQVWWLHSGRQRQDSQSYTVRLSQKKNKKKSKKFYAVDWRAELVHKKCRRAGVHARLQRHPQHGGATFSQEPPKTIGNTYFQRS